MNVKRIKADSPSGSASFFWTLLAVAMLLSACSRDRRPDDVLSPLQMSEFLTEAYRIEAYNSIVHPLMPDTINAETAAAYADLLQSQGLTQEQVEKSLDYYGHRPDQFEKILGDVLYRLQ